MPFLATASDRAQDFAACRDAYVRLIQEGTLCQHSSLRSESEPQGQGSYLDLPPLGIVLSPLAVVAAESGAVIWYLLKIGALALACLTMPVRPTYKLLAFSMSAFGFAALRDLMMGNVSILPAHGARRRLALAQTGRHGEPGGPGLMGIEVSPWSDRSRPACPRRLRSV